MINPTDDKYDNSPDGDFASIPPGNYMCAVKETDVTESKSGRPMVKVTLEITGPQFAGRLLWDYFVTNHEVGVNRFVSLLRAVGCTKPVDEQSPASVHNALQGRVVEVKTKSEEYGGEQRAKVHYYSEPKGDDQQKMTGDGW
jgi:hypothetical protein